MTSSNKEPLRLHIYGHVSAQPQALASALHGEIATEVTSDSDCAIFAINPSAGIDADTIAQWEQLDDYQIPRLVLVTGLEGQELDFDDAVLVANRVFTELVTPYLVLHNDIGSPVALIDLQTQQITDYSKAPPQIHDSEAEHRELIADFRDEYLEQLESAGEDAFAAGLLFPAIPVNIANGMGVDIVQKYLAQLPSGS